MYRSVFTLKCLYRSNIYVGNEGSCTSLIKLSFITTARACKCSIIVHSVSIRIPKQCSLFAVNMQSTDQKIIAFGCGNKLILKYV